MFVGSINQDLRALVAEITKTWKAQEIYIGCSGNFTIERILKSRPFKLKGNDVSLYSSAIGHYLAGHDMRLEIKDDQMKWLEPYIQKGIPRIATLLLCTSMLDGYHRTEPFFVRRRNAYHDQWDRMFEETVEKTEKALDGLTLDEYYAGDVVEWVEQAPKTAGFISFPPTYSGGYERLYQAFNDVFDWDEPEYEMFSTERFDQMIECVKEKQEWMMARDEPIPGLEGYEVGKVQTSLRSKPLIVYANKAHHRITMPHQTTEILKIPRMNENTEITEESYIGFHKISQAQMNTLRSLYLNPGIAPASAALNLAVLIDGRLIGAIGLSRSQFSMGDAYMMTDFVIRPLQYKRASKLVLATALSQEVQRVFEQQVGMKIESISTTAFTAKPVSMKYRGLFEVHSRKDDPPRINYSGQAGKWSMQEGLKWWLKKHAKYKN